MQEKLEKYFSKLLDMTNLQEQVKKAFCYQKLFWPFTVWINCSSDLKIFENSRPSASNFKSFSRSLEHFFLTPGQNNFGNKIPYLLWCCLWSIDILTSDHFGQQNVVGSLPNCLLDFCHWNCLLKPLYVTWLWKNNHHLLLAITK